MTDYKHVSMHLVNYVSCIYRCSIRLYRCCISSLDVQCSGSRGMGTISPTFGPYYLPPLLFESAKFGGGSPISFWSRMSKKMFACGELKYIVFTSLTFHLKKCSPVSGLKTCILQSISQKIRLRTCEGPKLMFLPFIYKNVCLRQAKTCILLPISQKFSFSGLGYMLLIII